MADELAVGRGEAAFAERGGEDAGGGERLHQVVVGGGEELGFREVHQLGFGFGGEDLCVGLDELGGAGFDAAFEALVGLLQGARDGELFGDVGEGGDAVAAGHDGAAQVDGAAVGGVVVLAALAGGGGRHGVHEAEVQRVEAGGAPGGEVGGVGRAGRGAEQAEEVGVAGDQGAAGVEDGDALADVVERGLQEGGFLEQFALAPAGFGAFDLGDVGVEGDGAAAGDAAFGDLQPGAVAEGDDEGFAGVAVAVQAEGFPRGGVGALDEDLRGGAAHQLGEGGAGLGGHVAPEFAVADVGEQDAVFGVAQDDALVDRLHRRFHALLGLGFLFVCSGQRGERGGECGGAFLDLVAEGGGGLEQGKGAAGEVGTALGGVHEGSVDAAQLGVLSLQGGVRVRRGGGSLGVVVGGSASGTPGSCKRGAGQRGNGRSGAGDGGAGHWGAGDWGAGCRSSGHWGAGDWGVSRWGV